MCDADVSPVNPHILERIKAVKDDKVREKLLALAERYPGAGLTELLVMAGRASDG